MDEKKLEGLHRAHVTRLAADTAAALQNIKAHVLLSFRLQRGL